VPATRQGSRWLHEPPTEDEIKEWFEAQPLHPGMSPGPYMGGIVLIGATEKVKMTRRKQNGDPYLAEVEQAVFVPYVKVDTRIAYFRDYVRVLNDGKEDGDFYGVIEAVPQKRVDDRSSPYYNENLPDGFGVYPVRNSNDSVNRYLVCTMRVAIYKRPSGDDRVQRSRASDTLILQGVGSKQTTQARNYADDNAVMKAETGAIGRALGVAGILVVGTGVATAEDVQEAQAGPVGAAGATAEGAVLPTAETAAAAVDGPSVPEGPGDGAALPETAEESDESLRERALALRAEMEKDYPAAWAAYTAWWNERGFGQLGELGGPSLKGAVIKLERDLDALKANPPG
jgi:hypothetical protein